MFSNFELNRLHLPGIENYNIYIVIILILLIIVSIRKSPVQYFFDASQTIQVRGAAIFFVVLTHFWVYIFDQTPLSLSTYAVSLFLILSGLAHGLLYETGEFSCKDFIIKKIQRIFIPYWFCTILFLTLDYYILGRTDISMTTLGINIRANELTHLDCTRWFITLILLWYFIFSLSRQYFPKKISCILYTSASLLIIIRYFGIWHLGNVHNTLAFPLGYTIAKNREWVVKH